MATRKTKILLAVPCAGLALAAVLIATRRPTLADPAAISKLRPNDLRDSEIECLIRAAFAKASAVAIECERGPSITVTDPKVLNNLAEQFAVGVDPGPRTTYRHPRLEYTRLTFDGPYPLRLVFAGEERVLLMGDEPNDYRFFYVRNRFCLALADLLGLKPVE
ncbi:MAG TPA: hypothetical protein VJ783_17115 [Pirellulales bacterium]|nr:hypothetical protein [Pirellulales bacterium]